MRSIESINESIRKGKAKVFTASEIKDMVRNGRMPSTDEVDVVTCGTFGVMSGTMAILSVPVASPGTFRKADSIRINGVPAFPGPCPNENLGIVDCVVYGTSHADDVYGGGHLFRDIADGRTLNVDVTSEGRTFETAVGSMELQFTRLVVTRGAFRNYTAFVNPSEGRTETIFSVTGMKGPSKECSVSGCGDINPVQNDPSLRFLGEGTRILLNGADGMIMGTGTRSSAERPNLSAFGDLREMDGSMMGGFVTSAGPECLTSFATAIPIVDDGALNAVRIMNGDIAMPIADVRTRTSIAYGTYGDVWDGTSRSVDVNRKNCVNCKHCNAETKCPVSALRRTSLDRKRCVVCGACVNACVGNVFRADLGHVDHKGTAVPITLRQSDRNRAEELSKRLKERIMGRDWKFGGA